ncbi:unnamed protein product (mitochondrion) [Musa banksii]
MSVYLSCLSDFPFENRLTQHPSLALSRYQVLALVIILRLSLLSLIFALSLSIYPVSLSLVSLYYLHWCLGLWKVRF